MAERRLLTGEEAARRLRQAEIDPLEAKVRQDVRPEVEDEVRAELEPKYDADRAMERDRAVKALAIFGLLIGGALLVVAIPLGGAVFGLAVRLYHLAAGQ
jgi:hypothetical protein